MQTLKLWVARQKFYNCSIWVELLAFLVGVVVSNNAIGARGLGFHSQADQGGHSDATATMFLQSCVAQTLGRKNGPRHSLHASE